MIPERPEFAPEKQTRRGAPKHVRLWLDDIRPMPDGYTHWCERADTAIGILSTGTVGHISLDHDLTEEHYGGTGYCSGRAHVGTGYSVAAWIEDAVARGFIDMPTWEVHSMNPSGAARIRSAMESADRISRSAPPRDTGRDAGDEQP